MARAQWTWGPDPKKTKMPVLEKVKVIFEMEELIESKLWKKYVKSPPKDKERNFIVDLYTVRRGQYFYFCAKYQCRAKNRIADYFEHRFARLESTPGGSILFTCDTLGSGEKLNKN